MSCEGLSTQQTADKYHRVITEGAVGVHPIEVGRPLAKPSPLFGKLDPALGETGPEWAPIQT